MKGERSEEVIDEDMGRREEKVLNRHTGVRKDRQSSRNLCIWTMRISKCRMPCLHRPTATPCCRQDVFTNLPIVAGERHFNMSMAPIQYGALCLDYHC